MKNALVLSLCFAVCSSLAIAQAINTTPLPRDAADVVSRLIDCSHFSGEMNGDGSEHDKEVIATINSLNCDEMEHKSKRLLRKYEGNTAVVEAIQKATAP